MRYPYMTCRHTKVVHLLPLREHISRNPPSRFPQAAYALAHNSPPRTLASKKYKRSILLASGASLCSVIFPIQDIYGVIYLVASTAFSCKKLHNSAERTVRSDTLTVHIEGCILSLLNVHDVLSLPGIIFSAVARNRWENSGTCVLNLYPSV
jgi:hypothetical protein